MSVKWPSKFPALMIKRIVQKRGDSRDSRDSREFEEVDAINSAAWPFICKAAIALYDAITEFVQEAEELPGDEPLPSELVWPAECPTTWDKMNEAAVMLAEFISDYRDHLQERLDDLESLEHGDRDIGALAQQAAESADWEGRIDMLNDFVTSWEMVGGSLGDSESWGNCELDGVFEELAQGAHEYFRTLEKRRQADNRLAEQHDAERKRQQAREEQRLRAELGTNAAGRPKRKAAAAASASFQPYFEAQALVALQHPAT